jgi:hypothetical protein
MPAKARSKKQQKLRGLWILYGFAILIFLWHRWNTPLVGSHIIKLLHKTFLLWLLLELSLCSHYIGLLLGLINDWLTWLTIIMTGDTSI